MSNSESQRPGRIVGTSLKMYFDLPTTRAYLTGVAKLSSLASSRNLDLFVVPDFISILPGRDILNGTPVLLGAQDTCWEEHGAYTGEVSPVVLAQAGVRIVVIGHAERRRIFHETDEEVGRKAAAVCKQGLIPLICVGEKASSPIASAAVGMAVEEVWPQVTIPLRSCPDDAEVIVAYEPVWAIGKEEPAGPDHVVAVTKEIRRMVGNRKGTTRILYGGSAGPGTFTKLADGVDGLFLGRFAHDLKNLELVLEEVGQI